MTDVGASSNTTGTVPTEVHVVTPEVYRYTYMYYLYLLSSWQAKGAGVKQPTKKKKR